MELFRCEQMGLFVEIQENKCEGMVSVKRMLDDFYQRRGQLSNGGMRHGRFTDWR